MDALADRLDDPLSIVATCRRHGVPMFLPALNDSSIGIGLTEHHHRWVSSGKPGVVISSIQDNYELCQIVARSPATAAFFVAGGVPKNYINDAVVTSYVFGQPDHGHRYALQVTTAVTADGGLSGSTLDEAESWGKVRHGAIARDGVARADRLAAAARDRRDPGGAREGPPAPAARPGMGRS